MKKNILKFLSVLFCVAFFLTGCATVSDVYNKDGSSIYYGDVKYYQGQIVQVGDYIYYGNGYTDASGEDFDYSLASQTGYLSRLNVSNPFNYDEDTAESAKTNTSPLGIEKVNDKLIGYQNQDMFALGNYIYFTSANTHKTSNLENDYSQVSLFRVKFNGDGFQEFGTFRNDENSIRKVVKGSDGNYYYVIYAPTSEEGKYNLYSIKIGDNIGETVTLAEDVKSVAICDENSTQRNVIYSVTSENTEIATDCVKSVDFATGEITDLDPGVVGSTISFVGRVGDIVFYSYTLNGISEVYYKDIVNSDKYFNPTRENKFYNATSISNIQAAGKGYVFVSTTSSSVMYKTLDTSFDPIALLTSEDYSDLLFIDGDYVYFSNDTSIGRINIINKIQNPNSEVEKIVTMTSIISGQCGYTGDYIYFYAQLEEIEDDENTDEDEEEEVDTNYYMYRTDKQGNYQLVGQTKPKSK